MERANRDALQILFVEDNDDHAELVVRSLTEHDMRSDIHRVSDGEQALDYLFRRGRFADPATSPRPHVILLDLRLPKVDGLEVLREIKASEEHHRVPVVILTTSEAESDIARAQDTNANAYVVKPLDFAMFSALMRDLGYFWLGWNQPPRRNHA